jgi:hypothetical protein
MTVPGYFTGAAFAHNFLPASGLAGFGTFGPVAVIIELVFCAGSEFLMREKIA